MTKILIVDDEISIRNVLKVSLKTHGFEVFEAGLVSEAVAMTVEFHPQLIILDLGLPDGNGIDVLKTIRQWSRVPIIVLTVDDVEKTKVELLECGADDYVTKPFGFLELLARIGVALRHAQVESASPVFQSGKLKVDLSTREVFVDGRRIHLTATEYEILRKLVRNGGQVIPQKQLLSEIWGPLGIENPHYLRIYIGHLRKKIEEDPARPQHVLTEPGVGYRLRSSSK